MIARGFFVFAAALVGRRWEFGSLQSSHEDEYKPAFCQPGSTMETVARETVTDVSFEDIEGARERIAPHVQQSPCPYSELFSQQFGCKVYLKLENLHLTGSFKERGACNRLIQMSDQDRADGVVAASAGNHAQAVALYASKFDIQAKIVMPEGTPLVKVTRTRNFGGEVILKGANFDEAYDHAVEVAKEENRHFIHPFNDSDIIAGQGTIGLELLEQNPYLDTVLVPIGGGGMAAGIAVAIKETNPKIRVIGVEAEVLSSMKASIEAEAVVELPAATTLCDGIAVRRVGELPRRILSMYLDGIVTVSEQEVAGAVLDILETEKMIAEGAAAAPIAALAAEKIENIKGRRVCAVISGGNIDVNVVARIIERGLVATGRIYRLDLQLRDTPGALAEVLAEIAEMDANVLEVHHNRTFAEGSPVGMTNVEFKLETRGADHIERLRTNLKSAGYRFLDHL